MRHAPYFDDLRPGDVLDDAPALTISDGHASLHQAIVGDRLRLPLDRRLARSVLGDGSAVAHPQLVCDVAIGQSTQVTQRVKANLFYRGLVFRRAVRIGDTLRTVTTVEALRENVRRPDRAPTGIALLHMRTEDHDGRTVLDFRRCAMLPLSPGAAPTGRASEILRDDVRVDDLDAGDLVAGWDLAAFRAHAPRGPHFDALRTGDRWDTMSGDVVSSAPELARLTLNVAGAHHDVAAAGGRRLVYGGHTIGLAAAQTSRILPNLVTIAAWDRCDHTGPVHEGDALRASVEITGRSALSGGGGLVRLRVRVVAASDDDEAPRDVLDWRLVGVMA